jgi:hypothetical protein
MAQYCYTAEGNGDAAASARLSNGAVVKCKRHPFAKPLCGWFDSIRAPAISAGKHAGAPRRPVGEGSSTRLQSERLTLSPRPLRHPVRATPLKPIDRVVDLAQQLGDLVSFFSGAACRLKQPSCLHVRAVTRNRWDNTVIHDESFR